MHSDKDSAVKITIITDVEFASLTIEGRDDLSSRVEDEQENTMLLLRVRKSLETFLSDHKKVLKGLVLLILFAAYCVYYGFAMAYSVNSAIALTVFTALGLLLILYNWISDRFEERLKTQVLRPLRDRYRDHWPLIRWLVCTVVLVASVMYLFLCVIRNRQQIRSFVGAIIFLALTFITSTRPDKVPWPLVGLGLFVQLVLGVIVLRWPAGFEAVNFVFKELFRFLLYYPMEGAATVYGDPLFLLHPIAMFVSSFLIYVVCWFGIIYCLLQSIRIVRWIKGWLPHITDSQLHLFLVSSDAIVSGYALTFVSVTGVNVHHLVTGMVLCVPAGAAISLINFPDTEKSTFNTKKQKINEERPRFTTNIFMAAATAIFYGVKIVALIYAHVLAFASIYALFDSVYSWLASRVGFDTNIVATLGYAFAPISYLMGVRLEDCYFVGCIVADKTFGLVLRAIRDLGYTISLNAIPADTAVIATHAIIGFSVFGTLAAWMGLFRAVSMRHRPRMMSIFPRVMFNAHIVCFYSASVAVILSPEAEYEEPGTSTPTQLFVIWLLKSLPSYKDLMNLAKQ